MLSGVTASALAMTGTAVFRIVVSSDSMKKAPAASHGRMRLTASGDEADGAAGKKSSERVDRERDPAGCRAPAALNTLTCHFVTRPDKPFDRSCVGNQYRIKKTH